MAIRSKTGPDTNAEKSSATTGTHLVDERIQSWGGWRAQTLTAIRQLIHQAAPDVAEDCKWMKPSNPLGVAIWSHAGILCTGEAYKQTVKLTFARGAALADPAGLFNASLDGNVRRAIDIAEGAALDADAFKSLIRAAIAENLRCSALKPTSRSRK